MLFEQKRTRIQRKSDVAQAPEGLDAYFKTIAPEDRKMVLDQCTDPEYQEEVQQMKKLFDIRYQMGKNGKYSDSFLRHFIEFRMVYNNLDGWFAEKKNRKIVRSGLEHMCLIDHGEFSEEILYGEMCQLAALYIETCFSDTNYTSIYCGFGKISDNSIREKLHKDLEVIGEIVPKHLKLEQESRLLTKAILDTEAEYL